MEKKITVHMIGQAHLDPVWLWRWTEGRAEALATCQSAVDRLEEYPAFHFVRGEAQVYEWVRQENPALFEKIRTLVKEGRWHLVNGMVIQPDMNLPQGESFVRQFLLGKLWMIEQFGVEPRVAYCVDSFGHAATLPQIFKKCGFDSYVFMRPGPHEKDLPGQAFWWESPDGSRVVAYRIPISYGTGHGDQREHIEKVIATVPENLETVMCFFGLGNHGGGPTKRQIEDIQALAQEWENAEIRFSSPDAYFDQIRPALPVLPVVKDELQIHSVGCYSVNSLLKRSHRQAECGLLLAERMAVLDNLLTGHSVPAEKLKSLWHDVAFNQFHDILCGTSIKEAEDEAILAFGRAILGAGEIANAAGRSIASQIDTSGPGGSVIIFNPFACPVEQYIEIEPWTEWQSWEKKGWGLVDEQGRPVAHQLIETHEALSWPDFGLNRLVFKVQIPPLGYRLYRFAPGLPRLEPQAGAQASPSGLENERLSVKLDPSSGEIVSCLDKTTGLELVGAGGWNVAQVLADESDTWSHGVRFFDRVIGRFGNAVVTVYEHGPLQASLLIERTYEQSTWLQQITLRQGVAELLVRNWLFWNGRGQIVKLAWDLPVSDSQSAHDIPFGWLARPCDGAEVPTLMWMDASGRCLSKPDQVVGLAVINDGKYGCDVSGSTARLTILRCPPYAHHQPHPLGSKLRYDWIDQGPQEFTLVLKPHLGDWRDHGVVQRALELNLPLLPVTMHAHSGDLQPVGSLASLSSDEISLSALKPAEDGNGFIARFVDRHGRGGKGSFCWMGQEFPVEVAPFEVVTCRFNQFEEDGHWVCQPCDLLERRLP